MNFVQKLMLAGAILMGTEAVTPPQEAQAQPTSGQKAAADTTKIRENAVKIIQDKSKNPFSFESMSAEDAS
ncbi:MAG: hypothetical protein EB060_01485, partial [Proteobacteria bacterium]|nr:hypothetical protein [Pseudomonadota bacterium]